MSEEQKLIKKKKPKGCLIVILVFFVIGAIIAGTQAGQQISETGNKSENVILDVGKFSKISTDELIAIMGDPLSVGEINYTSPKGKEYLRNSYYYNDNKYEFLAIDDKVIALFIHLDSDPIKYKNEKGIFSMFGITPADTIVKVADTGFALRYESVTENIEEFWIPIMDSKEKKIEKIQIKYDLTYYDTLPRIAMSISEKTDIQTRCQNGVKSILKSPSTAKFPNITNWYIGKDKEKIVVQSYVDAQNSFGAMIRSEFQVIFSSSGDTVTSLIMDGVEYIK